MVREVLEETGIRARIAGYLGVLEGKRSFLHYFNLEIVRVEAAPAADEIAELRFVTPARALDLVRAHRDRQVLQMERRAVAEQPR